VTGVDTDGAGTTADAAIPGSESSDPESGQPTPGGRRFGGSLSDLEGTAHIAAGDQVVEIPGQRPGHAPGDDELGRRQRDALRAGG
jgi:hypothetical protein